MALTIIGEPNCFYCSATSEECTHRDELRCEHSTKPSTAEGRALRKARIRKYAQDVFDCMVDNLVLTQFLTKPNNKSIISKEKE